MTWQTKRTPCTTRKEFTFKWSSIIIVRITTIIWPVFELFAMREIVEQSFDLCDVKPGFSLSSISMMKATFSYGLYITLTNKLNQLKFKSLRLISLSYFQLFWRRLTGRIISTDLLIYKNIYGDWLACLTLMASILMQSFSMNIVPRAISLLYSFQQLISTSWEANLTFII